MSSLTEASNYSCMRKSPIVIVRFTSPVEFLQNRRSNQGLNQLIQLL